MKYCVIGLGRFGSTLAKELASQGHEVLAVDLREEAVSAIKDNVSLAVQADAADPYALKELGAHDVDAAAVCIGNDFQASLMAVSHLKEFKVGKIYCRIINHVHRRLANALEVDDRIQPEDEAARQFARRLSVKQAKQHFDLTGDYTLVEVEVPERLVGTRLADSKLREKHKLNVVAIRARGAEQARKENEETEEGRSNDPAGLCGVPDPDRPFEKGDYLVLFGREKDVESFSNT